MLTRRSSRSTIILSLRKSPARAAGAQEESPPSTADVRLHKRRILNILYLSTQGKLHICYKMCPSETLPSSLIDFLGWRENADLNEKPKVRGISSMSAESFLTNIRWEGHQLLAAEMLCTLFTPKTTQKVLTWIISHRLVTNAHKILILNHTFRVSLLSVLMTMFTIVQRQ